MQNAKDFGFELIKKDKKSQARVGKIITAHGIIKTPSFVPVGTKASVRSLIPQDLKDLNIQIIFGNTYHLHLQPGEAIVKDFGGLAKFMRWDGPARNAGLGVAGGPTITDSGGFQVFSLGKKVAGRLPRVADDARLNFFQRQSKTRSLNESLSSNVSKKSGINATTFSSSASGQAPASIKFIENLEDDESEEALVKITEDGVEFRSHIDGSRHIFTPEVSIEIQKKLGADIILAFDECAPYPSTHEYTKEAMGRTHDWAIRCLRAAQGKSYHPWQQALYGIVQGGVYQDLRKESAKFISKLPFDGIAVGGVSVGESKEEMVKVLNWVVPLLPEGKPRHLLGIGEVDDIFNAVERGIDTFDCVIPTRFGRYGIIFSGKPEGNMKNKFRIDIKRIAFAKDKGPLCKNCECKVCKNFTRGYINHLFKANELSAYNLASYHNVYFLNNLVRQIRDAIIKGEFEKMKKEWLVW